MKLPAYSPDGREPWLVTEDRDEDFAAANRWAKQTGLRMYVGYVFARFETGQFWILDWEVWPAHVADARRAEAWPLNDN